MFNDVQGETVTDALILSLEKKNFEETKTLEMRMIY